MSYPKELSAQQFYQAIDMLLVKTRIGPSEIHGIGLFADQFIPRGAITWEFREGFDLRFSELILDELSEPAREQFLKYSYFDVSTNCYELCSDDARFFNHSDAPNTMSVNDEDVALRDIAPGEELTCDYRTFDAHWRSKLNPNH